jgi:hypothetical protein
MRPLKLVVLMVLVVVVVVIWFIHLHSKTFTHFKKMNQQTWYSIYSLHPWFFTKLWYWRWQSWVMLKTTPFVHILINFVIVIWVSTQQAMHKMLCVSCISFYLCFFKP